METRLAIRGYSPRPSNKMASASAVYRSGEAGAAGNPILARAGTAHFKA